MHMNRHQTLGVMRRDFLTSSLGAFALASTGRAWGAHAPSNRVRLAIVGCHEKGRGAEVMKRALQVPGVEIAAVCDVDARAREFAADCVQKITQTTPRQEVDLRKLLEDPSLDGIISETPDHWHATSAILAMRAGKHVYVEKPCAFCPQECDEILKTWKQTGKVFQMGSQRRSATSYREAVQAITQEHLIGETKWGKCWYMTRRKPIGRGNKGAPPPWLNWDLWQGPAPHESYQDNIVHYNWHWFRQWGTGEAGNNSVHFVDIARWCLEEQYPTRVTSAGGKFWIPQDDDWAWPDTQNISWNFADGKFITWEGLSCTDAKPFQKVSTGALIYGTKGTAFFNPNGAVEICSLSGEVLRKWNANGKMASLTNTDDRSGGGWTDSTVEHVANFVEAIRTNNPEMAYSNARIGTQSTFLALTGNVAQLSGQTIEIDPTTGRLLTRAGAPFWSRTYEKGWEL